MKSFVETAEVDDTKPSPIAKFGRDFKEVIAEICSLTNAPVSAEVAALVTAGMTA